MFEIDWSKADMARDITEEELTRSASPSGNKCPYCDENITVGEDEAFGACHGCYEG